MTDQNCPNCQYPIEADHRFCPGCGQKTNEKLTLGVLFSNTISNYFSVDSRFFVSFVPLLFQPGYLPRKFVDGKRNRFLHPAQFYLFISVIFFFLFSFHTRRQSQQFDDILKHGFENSSLIADSGNNILTDSVSIDDNLKKLEDKGIKIELDSVDRTRVDSAINSNGKSNMFDFSRKELDSLTAAGASQEEKLKAMGLKDDAGLVRQRIYTQLLKVYERRGGGLLEAFYDSIPVALFFLLPLYALFLKLFFYRKGLYAHHLVFSFYFFSFLFTAFTIIMLGNFIYPIPDWIDWLLVLMTGIYLWIAIKKFYGQGYFVSLLKTGIISFLYLLVVLPGALVVLVIVSFLIY
jgi:hypothetical protein